MKTITKTTYCAYKQADHIRDNCGTGFKMSKEYDTFDEAIERAHKIGADIVLVRNYFLKAVATIRLVRV